MYKKLKENGIRMWILYCIWNVVIKWLGVINFSVWVRWLIINNIVGFGIVYVYRFYFFYWNRDLFLAVDYYDYKRVIK